jgi:Lrp/AsnC family transcriptional regulator for asnA, asnC and gidA
MATSVDDRIVALLREEPRVTARAVAKAVGVAEATARGRIADLLRSGSYTPTIFVHPQVAGDGVIAMLRASFVESKGMDTALALEPFSSAPWAAVSTEGLVLLAQVVADSPEDLALLLGQARAAPGVVSLGADIVLKLYTGQNWGSEGVWPSSPQRSPDEVDRELIRALQRDGRASFTSLAAASGLTVPATRRRVLRLRDEGLIRFALRERERFSTRHEASVSLVVAPDAHRRLLDALTQRSEVRYAVEQTGSASLACYLIAGSNADLTRAVGEISAEPGVQSTKSTSVTALRDDLDWLSAGPRS